MIVKSQQNRIELVTRPVGDQIVEINGVNTKAMTHADAIDLIKSGGSIVRLLVRRANSSAAAANSTAAATAGAKMQMFGEFLFLAPNSSVY